MNDYSEIIDHPHHVSTTRPHMSMTERAAQFSPFKALTGYDEAVDETARDNELYMNENGMEHDQSLW
ncbi:MAG: hypothetical protein J5910_02030 [Lachnospiraceae bacterium]|nr:hypothetical protein [Lachnospiraceae bacterium]